MSPGFLVIILLKICFQYTQGNIDIDFKPIVESPNSKNEITQGAVDLLYLEELEKILKQGPSNRFWDSVVYDLLENSQDEKNIYKKRQIRNMIFNNSKFEESNSTEIPQSTLNTRSRVQLASQSSETSRLIDASATIALEVTKTLAERVPVETLRRFQTPSQFCPFMTSRFCDPNDRFPSIDGVCNNLRTPWLGKSETPFKRYIRPAYEDGFNSPRSTSRLGTPLPNPRQISRALFTDNFQMDNTITHLLAMFGQFLSHDFTSAAVSADNSGRIVDCPCNSGNPSCMSVVMPSNENMMRMSCMRFTRSSSAFSSFDCRLGHREQLNLLSSFIHLTQVYGTSDSRSRELRSNFGGQLRTSPGVNARTYLPHGQDGGCRNTDQRIRCFAAGEGRVNENLALTGLHVLFLREHNRIASELQQINPQWNDNRLFNEARKITIAEMQHIVYAEWLPAIIGWNTATVFDLVPLSGNTYYRGYNENANPTLSGEFATAAFRFGHTLVRTQLNRFDSNNNRILSSRALDLFDIIFRPTEAYNAAAGGIDSIVIGMINEPASRYDPSIANALQNRLFEAVLSDGSVMAIDLAATNINRGRDHGIPGYNVFRERCGFRRANSFQDLNDLIPNEIVNVLSSVYQHVDDIDFYVGGLSERPSNGALVGPTFACIIANQFKDIKQGDRFFYENGPSPTAFTADQLQELRRVSLSRLICDNFDLNTVQSNAFLMPSNSNNRVQCSSIARVDLSRWRE